MIDFYNDGWVWNEQVRGGVGVNPVKAYLFFCGCRCAFWDCCWMQNAAEWANGLRYRWAYDKWTAMDLTCIFWNLIACALFTTRELSLRKWAQPCRIMSGNPVMLNGLYHLRGTEWLLIILYVTVRPAAQSNFFRQQPPQTLAVHFSTKTSSPSSILTLSV